MIGMKRKRSIFGPQSAPAMPSGGEMQQMGNMAMGQGYSQPEEKKPGLGTRLLGEGWEGKVAALGAALQGNMNAVPQYMAQQQAQRQQAAMLAERQRQQAALQAQRTADQYGLAQYRASLPTAQQKDFEFYGSLDEQGKATYHQMKPRYMTVQNGDGTSTIVPIGPNGPILNGQGAQPGGGSLPTFTDDDWNKAGGSSIHNTPAPSLGANGMPATLTRQQYEAIVTQMGAQDTEAWARRNNIKVMN